MEWQDGGILLRCHHHGETSSILTVLTENYGLHKGLVRSSSQRNNFSALQPGNQLELTWSARLPSHLGVYRIELIKNRLPRLISDRSLLLALNSIIALVLVTVPERQIMGRLYKETEALVDGISSDISWFRSYVKWEVMLLTELGYGLDLSVCAVTGSEDNLIYVSPKSGRAVSQEAGEPW